MTETNDRFLDFDRLSSSTGRSGCLTVLFIFDVHPSIDSFIGAETDDRFLDFDQGVGGEVAVCTATFVVDMFE